MKELLEKKEFERLLLIGKFLLMLFMFYFYTTIMVGIIDIVLSIFNISFIELNNFVRISCLALIESSLIYLFYLLNKKDLKLDFKNFKANFEKFFDIGIRWWILGFGLMGCSNLLISLFTPEDLSQNEEAVRSLVEILPVYMVFSVSIYAPFIEEVLFRKSLAGIFKSDWLYVVMSGFIFGALHVVSGLSSFYSFLHLIPYCALGFSFAIIYVKTKNIFVPMFFHFIHNTLAVVVLIISNFL